MDLLTSSENREIVVMEYNEKSKIPLPATEPYRRPHRLSARVFLRCAILCALFATWRVFLGPRNHYGTEDIPAWLIDVLESPRANFASSVNTTEQLLLSTPDPETARLVSRALATHPHLAGSKSDYNDALTMLEVFQTEFGIPAPSDSPVFPAGSAKSRKSTLDITSSYLPSAWVDIYYPELNTPLNRSLQILDDNGKALWNADLVEDGDSLDPEASKYRDAVPTFHGLSYDGEVEGPLIYANYGTKEDYDQLAASGANLTGKIVITRYGNIFRGLKIKGAEELGAAGVLIYSDPRDDGSVTVENGYAPYPAGPARNPTSVQRGSVQFISMYPGDPTTPGYPAYENSTRVPGLNIPSIPSLPISWTNAERLLEEIGGNSDGRLLTGKASETRIKLVNHVDTKVTPIWNTMAAIPGRFKDEVVIVGCHRDAWVMGAADPTSGTVSLHEVIRAFGALLKTGWIPLRTIVFASWDAEEYGLVGSTEWGEDFADWIAEHVVSYLNVDVSVAGSRWQSAGSPSLANLIRRSALDVPHPTISGKTLWDARYDHGPFSSPHDVDYEALTMDQSLNKAIDTGIAPLGSGSDYTVFLQRLGIASTDQGFGPTPSDAVYHYHSVYDSQRWQETYADPGFFRHVAVAKHLALLTLRMADSLLIPLNTTQYALELDTYLDKVEEIARASSLSPDFKALRKAIRRLQHASVKLDEEKEDAYKTFMDLLDKLPGRIAWGSFCEHKMLDHIARWFEQIFGANGGHPPPQPANISSRCELPFPYKEFIRAALRIQKANQKVIAFESGFIHEEGIKDREWYRHLGVAPGKWLGYGATTFPALTEAVEIEKNVTFAEYEAGRLTELLSQMADNLSS